MQPVGRVSVPSVVLTHSTQVVGAVGDGGGLAGEKPGNANGTPPKVRAKWPQDARLSGGMGSKHMAGELRTRDPDRRRDRYSLRGCPQGSASSAGKRRNSGGSGG